MDDPLKQQAKQILAHQKKKFSVQGKSSQPTLNQTNKKLFNSQSSQTKKDANPRGTKRSALTEQPQNFRDSNAKEKNDPKDKNNEKPERSGSSADYTTIYTASESPIASTGRGATNGLKDMGITAAYTSYVFGLEQPTTTRAATQGLSHYLQMQREAIKDGRVEKPLIDPRDEQKKDKQEERRLRKRQQEKEEKKERRRRKRGFQKMTDAMTHSTPSKDVAFLFDANGNVTPAVSEKKEQEQSRNERNELPKTKIANSKFLSLVKESAKNRKQNTAKEPGKAADNAASQKAVGNQRTEQNKVAEKGSASSAASQIHQASTRTTKRREDDCASKGK